MAGSQSHHATVSTSTSSPNPRTRPIRLDLLDTNRGLSPRCLSAPLIVTALALKNAHRTGAPIHSSPSLEYIYTHSSSSACEQQLKEDIAEVATKESSDADSPKVPSSRRFVGVSGLSEGRHLLFAFRSSDQLPWEVAFALAGHTETWPCIKSHCISATAECSGLWGIPISPVRPMGKCDTH